MADLQPFPGMRVLSGVLLVCAIAAAEPDFIVTGREVVVDGVAEVPPGLFGVHAANLPPERYAEWGITTVRTVRFAPDARPLAPGRDTPPGVDRLVQCLYDRYRPALVLSDPGWERLLADLGTAHGAAAQAGGIPLRVEFWNEPYLNWATKPGVNRDPRFYEPGVEGGPVTIKGRTQPEPFLVWRKDRWFVSADGRSQPTDVAVAVGNSWSREKLGSAPIGHEWELRGKRFRIVEALLPYDTSLDERQPDSRWWSGRAYAGWYIAMAEAYGRALKAADAEARFAVGWGFHLHQGGKGGSWLPWEPLFRPLIDRTHGLIDAIHEHHYGGDTRAVAAAYRTAWAYALATHGRRLRFWNTEAGPNFDAQRPDQQRDALEKWLAAQYPDPRLRTAMAAYAYLVRDVTWALAAAPAQAEERAAHEPGAGEGLAFRQLKPLRGRLLEVVGGVADGWAVASRAGDRLAVVVWNDALEPRTRTVRVQPPAGATLRAARAIDLRIAADAADLGERPLPVAPGALVAELALAPRQAVVVVAELAGAPEPAVAVVSAHAALPILQRAAPDAPATLAFTLDAAALAGAGRARVVLTVPDNADGALRATLDGRELTVPAGRWRLVAEVDPARLAPRMSLVVATTATPREVWSAALELER